MKGIIEFCKSKYKSLIPVMVVFVLLITVYFLYKEYKYDNYRNKQEVSVFQYFGGIRNDYTAIVTYNLKNVIVDVEPKGKKIDDYDSIPIYYADEDKIIFPSEMSVVFPIRDGSQYKMYKYSIYQKKESIHTLTINNITNEYDYFFLFDGNGLYFFPDEVTLNIDGKEYMKLSPMSYVQIVGGYTMTYYDRENDKSEVIEIENKAISVTSEAINVNLSERHCLSFGKKILLVKPYNLNSLTNWQKMYVNDIINFRIKKL